MLKVCFALMFLSSLGKSMFFCPKMYCLVTMQTSICVREIALAGTVARRRVEIQETACSSVITSIKHL